MRCCKQLGLLVKVLLPTRQRLVARLQGGRMAVLLSTDMMFSLFLGPLLLAMATNRFDLVREYCDLSP